MSGELVKPPKAKGAGKNTDGKKAMEKASKLPPACFAAFSKMATPAAGSLDVGETPTPPHNQWEEEDDKGESITATEHPGSDVDQCKSEITVIP